MDTVALLGPNLAYDVKRTFVSVPDATPVFVRTRAASSPPAFRYCVTVETRRGDRSPQRRSKQRKAVVQGQFPHATVQGQCPHAKAQGQFLQASVHPFPHASVHPFPQAKARHLPRPSSRPEKDLSECSTASNTDHDTEGSDDGHCGTALRLGNLPNRTKPARIRALIGDMGLHAHVDSIYMPLDTRTGVGKGYAFVHFTDEASAVEFMSKANGQRLPRSNNPKTMQVTYAVRHTIAQIPKKGMSKCADSSRTPTAFLWLR